MKTTLLLFSSLIAISVNAQIIVDTNNFKYLDINQVKAAIMNRSDMHWDIAGNGNASYEVPKGSGKNSNFTSALWIGGLDASNNLRLGAQTYRQGGVDFWPGPLNTNDASIDTATARNYDKIWKVSYTDINAFVTNFNNGNVQNGSYVVPNNIATWPAHGTTNQAQNLAPFVDNNNDGLYNPLHGDYPKIKGDQTLYFIYNDNLATHQSSGGAAMGIEVHVMAYAYGCPNVLSGKNELAYTTFYNYKIMNRSSNLYNNVYVGLWSDVDLGNYNDDYVGCNVSDNYGYAYNGDNSDEGVYGSYAPAQGMAILKGPISNSTDGVDNNNNGTIDEPNEECLLNKFTYFNNSFAGVNFATVDPTNASHFYNYLRGYWKDNSQLTCGGNGYGGTITTNYVYSGDPNSSTSTDPQNTCGNWIENTAPSDRRFIMSSGPFTFLPGQMQEIEYAFVTSFDSTQANQPLLSVAKLKTDIQKVRAFYDLVNKPSCLQNITIGINELIKQNDFSVYPNPNNGLFEISFLRNEFELQNASVEILNSLGQSIQKMALTKPTTQLNLQGYTSGVYFVKLAVNNSSIVKKVVKQ